MAMLDHAVHISGELANVLVVESAANNLVGHNRTKAATATILGGGDHRGLTGHD